MAKYVVLIPGNVTTWEALPQAEKERVFGGHADQLQADVGDGLEQLLRAADGDDDLYHAANDDAAKSAG